MTIDDYKYDEIFGTCSLIRRFAILGLHGRDKLRALLVMF